MKLSILLLALLSGLASAATVTWTGASTGSPNYNEGSNWSSGSAPSAGDTIVFGDGLSLGSLDTPTSPNLSGSTVVLGNNSTVRIGENHGPSFSNVTPTTFTIGDGSTLFLKGGANLNGCTLNLNLNSSGKIQFGNPWSGTNGVNLNLTLSVDSSQTGMVTRELAYFTYSTAGSATLDLSRLSLSLEGLTQVDGVKDASIENPSSLGSLNKGEYRLVVTKGSLDNSTKLWVQYMVPEPATASLSLLGLGCLLWSRRRQG
ncbi:PEP-CTERM sorting domain-containing protein [Akkermansia sp.]|uniref:PEP-CTERM sorting domain-containing protein n=1 Tax=Akkermansia sp. TaxID=1872421 RepID=UPI0025BDD1E5|nr:PEP-CTERM sorting domain-containing protein [Akkermansia sp.]MCC8149039.1 PEP-CTERM sorting domain-containing protein [Akkermansia sp.]